MYLRNKIESERKGMLKKKLFASGLAAMMMVSVAVLPINVFAAENMSEQQFEEKTSFEIRNTNDLAVLSEELDRYIIQNPNSTEEEQEQHLISFMQNGGLNQVALRRMGNSVPCNNNLIISFVENNGINQVTLGSIGDYLPGYSNLNSAERNLALQHPIQAVKVYNAANTSTSKTNEVYGKNGWQDNSDAFRHCLWNALMKQSIGLSEAEQWANAHEHDASGIDKTMDLHNNKVGRSIDVSGKSLSSIVNSVKSKVRNGYCRRIVKNSLVATNGDGM